MKILKVKENKDGSASIDYELTDAEVKVIKETVGVKRLTKKRINKFVYDTIIKGMELQKQNKQ